MKEFTQEMLETLQKANNEVRGTKDYTKYLICCEAKTYGRWHFIGWHYPYTTGKIKTFKGRTYIITENSTGQYRYEVTDEVKNLLNI